MNQEKDTKIAELEAKIEELEKTVSDLQSQSSIPKLTLQEWLNKKYPTKEDKEKVKILNFIRIKFLEHSWYLELLASGISQLELGELDLSDYVNAESIEIDTDTWNYKASDCEKRFGIQAFSSPLTKIILGSKPHLKRLSLLGEKIQIATEMDLSDYPKLDSFREVYTAKLFKSFKFHPNYIAGIRTKSIDDWKKYRLITKHSLYHNQVAENVREFIDISDLDAIVENYNWNKAGDLEYHRQLFGSKSNYFIMDHHALDNLTNRILARMLIIQSRLVVGKLDNYEKALHEHCEGQQLCARMRAGDYTMEQAQVVINKALLGDKELLSRLQDLPYLAEEYKFDSPKYKFKDQE